MNNKQRSIDADLYSIAIFMGATSKKDENGDTYFLNLTKYGDRYYYCDLKYNKSWDWIMPVVEKILFLEWETKYEGTEKKSYSPSFNIHGGYWNSGAHIEGYSGVGSFSLLESTFQCCCRYIRDINREKEMQEMFKNECTDTVSS